VLAVNPAHAVRGPKYVVRRGKTPVLSEEEARRLIESIDTSTLVGLRDRALIGVMTYAFARIGAVVAMRVEDYYPNGKRWWVRLHEKGGKRHEMPAHHKLEAFLDEYLAAAGIRDDGKGPLFRTARGKTGVCAAVE
jgi:site-specific recombinase XerC